MYKVPVVYMKACPTPSSAGAGMGAVRRKREDEEEDEEAEDHGSRLEFPGVQDFTGDVEPLSASQLKLQKKLRKKAKSGGFETLGLSGPVFRAVKKKGYRVPTPIQRKTLPLVLAGYDVVAMARTGSGKTAAFLIPMLEKLKAHSSKSGARAVILSPTRELAQQTFKFCNELKRYTDLTASVLVGGDSMEAQFEDLSKNPDILVATPGRLMHHLSEVEGMSLRSVEYIVFDEADRLFEMGFAEQLRQILGHLSETRQTLLFSATLPRLLADFAKAGLRDPHLIRLDTETKISPDLKLAFFTLRHGEKPAALVHLVQNVIPSDQQTIIFVSTKHHVEYLYEVLKGEGIELSVVYGAMDQSARKIHVAKFQARKTMLLLVTDVAARGIDIPLLDNVVNYDFPAKPKLFVHRVGRAARAGRHGTAYSFFTADEMPFVLDLHLFLSKPIQPAPSEEEVVADEERVLQKVDQAVQRGATVYGRFPQAVLDHTMDRLREAVLQKMELGALQKSSENAFKLYLKTRPDPSSESIKRAKSLAEEGIHPLFRDAIHRSEAEASAFTERLKNFRPKQTVLEAEAEAAKSKNRKTPLAQAGEIMKRKRAVHEHVISAVHEQKRVAKAPENPTNLEIEELLDEDFRKSKRSKGVPTARRLPESFRDDEFFISSIPQQRHTEAGLTVTKDGEHFGPNRMDSEVLDLVPDDELGVQKQRATYHWDKKGKKFIKLNRGEKIGASGKIKTESGAKVNVGNRNIYKKWKEKTHREISTRGADGQTEDQPRGVTGKRKRGASDSKKAPIPNANVRDELRGLEEVRKHRQKKVTRQMGKGKGRSNDKDKGKGRSFDKDKSKSKGFKKKGSSFKGRKGKGK